MDRYYHAIIAELVGGSDAVVYDFTWHRRRISGANPMTLEENFDCKSPGFPLAGKGDQTFGPIHRLVPRLHLGK